MEYSPWIMYCLWCIHSTTKMQVLNPEDKVHLIQNSLYCFLNNHWVIFLVFLSTSSSALCADADVSVPLRSSIQQEEHYCTSEELIPQGQGDSQIRKASKTHRHVSHTCASSAQRHTTENTAPVAFIIKANWVKALHLASHPLVQHRNCEGKWVCV